MKTEKMFTGPRITLLIIFAFLAFVLGALIGRHWQKPLDQLVQSATVLPTPRAVQPFQLVDSQNQLWTNQKLQGHWTLLFFGFTHCGYMCPTTMGVLKQVYEDLQKQNKPLPQVLFVSIDPDRDTPKKIKEYVSSFNPDFQGATGSKQQIEKLTHDFSVVYMKVAAPKDEKAGAMNYQIDHSGTLLLINPKGELFAVFSMPHDAERITKDVGLIEVRVKG